MPALGVSLAASGAVGVASDLATAPAERVRTLPVPSDIAGLFPVGGLRRGSTVAVRGSTALLLALLAAPTASGSWAAVVGMPNVGLLAAAELGVDVERVALVRHPGAQLPAVVAALLDGVDIVAVAPSRLSDSHARRLSARARHRGAVLLSFGPWPGAELELTRGDAKWTGLGAGHGYLTSREVLVNAVGRGAAARPTTTSVLLQSPNATMDIPAPIPTPRARTPA